MKLQLLLALVLCSVVLGCAEPNRRFVNSGVSDSGNEVGVPMSSKGQASATAAGGASDVAALRPGQPCRIDLIRPAGEGQAYQGNVVRVDDKSIVLSNVISEGPMKRSREPSYRDLLEMRMPWSPAPTAIDWQRLPDKEIRIARSEVSSVKVLDHDPIVDYYTR